MRLRRIAPIVVLGVAAVGPDGPSSPPPAHAAAVTALPITSVYQVLADTAHGHVFISQGPLGGADAPIVVTNLTGTPVATIGDGARGMALSADDKTLYAAIGDSVTAFSTTTLKQTDSYATPGPAWQVALQSGRLWVGYQDSPYGEIGAIDLGNGSATWNVVPPGDWTDFPPVMAVDPSDNGILVTSSVGTTEAVTASYSVSDPAAVTQIASASLSCGDSEPSVLPGGKTFLCDGIPYGTATLAPDSSGTFYGGSAAVAPNGAIAVNDSGTVMAYPAGGTAPTAAYDEWWGLPLPSLLRHRIIRTDRIWPGRPVASSCFTVMESGSYHGGAVFMLLSLYPFERVPAPLTLTSTATTVGYDGSFTVTPHLGVTDGNRAYSVYVTVAGHPRQLVYSCPCDPSGSFTTGGSSWTTNTTYTAVFTGDARYEPATVNLAIKVGVKVSAALSGYYQSIRISVTQYRVYHHTATLKDAVAITPDKAGECVKLQIQKYADNAWRAYTMHPGCGTVSASRARSPCPASSARPAVSGCRPISAPRPRTPPT